MKLLKKLLTNIWFYVVLFVLSVAIPFAINEIYKFGQTHSNVYITLWDASDVFSFFGSYLSFFGSIVLGAVAVIQTADANEQAKEANKQTDRANQLAAQMQKLEQARFLSIVSVNKVLVNKQKMSCPNIATAGIDNPIIYDMVDGTYWNFTHCYHINVLFENNSDYPIVELFAHAKGFNREAKIHHGIKPATNSVYIAPHETQAIRFLIPSHFFEKYEQDGLKIELEFVNVFDFHTFGTITIERLAKYTNSTINKEYTYQIQKVNDVMPKESLEDSTVEQENEEST